MLYCGYTTEQLLQAVKLYETYGHTAKWAELLLELEISEKEQQVNKLNTELQQLYTQRGKPTKKCKNKNDRGSCSLHNLHCAYPKCEA